MARTTIDIENSVLREVKNLQKRDGRFIGSNQLAWSAPEGEVGGPKGGKMIEARELKMKVVLISIFVLLCFSLAPGAEFPEKPIHVLVGWPAGSQNDMTDRAATQVLQKILKQPVIIQNLPGGGGALVLGRIKTEKPEGYTLFQTGSPMYSRTPHLRAVPSFSIPA